MLFIFSVILHGLILGLLTYGAYTDLKTRNVPNWISYSVILISVPLIIDNAANITIVHVFFFTVIVVAYLKLYNTPHPIGGADVKIMLPLSLAMPLLTFTLFLFVMAIVIFIMTLKWRQTPGLIAIAAAYLIVIFI